MSPLIGFSAFLLAANALAAPNELALGKDENYPACKHFYEYTENRKCRVHSFSHPVGEKVAASSNPRPLARYPEQHQLAQSGGQLDVYFKSQQATSVMVLKDGQVVYENYQYERNSGHRFRSFSMAKTLTAILVGIALDKGFIRSLDDQASKYLPDIAGTVWGDATIESLLRMSSGANFDESSYGPNSDIAKWVRSYILSKDKDAFQRTAQSFNKRIFDQGSKFNYASADTSVLVHILENATKKRTAELTREWLWEPLGAEDDAYWLTAQSDGAALGESGFYASLRDWGKIGVLLANDGKVGDNQVIPYDFLMRATDQTLVPKAFRPGTATFRWGYGFQTWLFSNSVRTFALIGIYGQSVYVQPSSKLVFVQTSVYDKPSGDPAWGPKNVQWMEILTKLGGTPF